MAEQPNPGENTAPPAEPAAPVADQPTPPTGSEPENNTGEATVPSARLREETEKRRKAEEEREALQAELETLKAPPAPSSDELELEPDTEKLLDSYAKKRGLVSETELAAERQRIQVQQDVRDLENTPPNPGIPFNDKDVAEYAKANNLPITSKQAWVSAYRQLNYDKIVEAERQKAIDGYKAAGSGGAESPGSGGAIAPDEPELTSKDPKSRTRERIRNARQKLSV